MSTKALSQVLDDVRQGALPHPGEVHAATRELEAIEMAARDWAAVDGQPGPGKMQRLDTLLRSIAKETA